MTAFAIQNTRIETVADATLDQPVIRIAPTPFGQRLALLFDGQPQADGDYVVRHTPAIDDRMVEVIDALITLRYQHPTAVQLQLALPERLT